MLRSRSRGLDEGSKIRGAKEDPHAWMSSRDRRALPRKLSENLVPT